MSEEPLAPSLRLVTSDGETVSLEATIAARTELTRQLAVTPNGQALPTQGNAVILMALDPVLRHVAGYDEFASDSVLRGPPPVPVAGMPAAPGPYPRPWRPADVTAVHAYLQRAWNSAFERTVTERAMDAAAGMIRFHPVRDWLASLIWDGVPRLDTWLTDTFGVADTPYARAAGVKFMIAAVRRVRQPGCKFDCMLVLEGPQGILKSTALAVLFGREWFSDSLHADLRNKDAAISLHGKWCVEMAELEHLIRTEAETMKAFLSRPVDNYRPPWGSKNFDFPRQSVLVGTTNDDSGYLKDTENRRFWPVRCDFVDLDRLTLQRGQLWAEAASREATGETHWFDTDSLKQAATQQQEDRRQTDAWEEPIMEYLEIRKSMPDPPLTPETPDSHKFIPVRIAEILQRKLGVPLNQQEQRDQNRVARCLKKLKWVVKIEKMYGVSVRVYYPPGTKM